MAKPPTASGRAPATALANTSTSRSRVIGTAMASALARSDSTCSPTSRKTWAWPPTWTLRAASSRA